MLSAYYICCIYSDVLQKTSTMEANSGNSLIWVHIVCNNLPGPLSCMAGNCYVILDATLRPERISM